MSRRVRHLTVLIPGLLGFDQLGGVAYFRGVERLLLSALAADARVEHIVRVVPTAPTAGIERRAAVLRDETLRLLDAHAPIAALHLVGHSTGAVDARRLLTPQDPLPGIAPILQRVQTLISLTAPQQGAPLAHAATSLGGPTLLAVLAMLAGSEQSRVSVAATAAALSLLARIVPGEGPLDDLVGHLVDPRLWTWLRSVACDQAALTDLTPAAMAAFNARTPDRPGVRYACVLARVPPPDRQARPRSADSALFTFLWHLSTAPHQPIPLPPPQAIAALDAEILSTDSDGVVPTGSQVYGDVLALVSADHLDVVGQYRRQDAPGGRERPGWLRSGAVFSEAEFRHLWHTIAAAILTPPRKAP